MKFIFEGTEYTPTVWNPSKGVIGDSLAFDSETTPIVGKQTPDYVLGTVCTGDQVYFIQRKNIGPFWELHTDRRVFMHNAAFDLAVVTRWCGFDFGELVESGRLIDTSILYRLVRLAREGQVPAKYNLALISRELLGVEIDKDQDTRCGFGAFVEGDRVAYKKMPDSHLRYAAIDSIATFRCAQKLMDQAACLSQLHPPPLPVNGTNGINGTNGTAMPDPGPLSHHIQLRGEIALKAIEALGLGVDQGSVKALDEHLAAQLSKAETVLRSYGYAPGASGNRSVLKALLAKIEGERGARLPTTPTGQRSTKESDLAVFRDHPFIDAYLENKGAAKLRSTYVCAFRNAGTRVFPRYNPMLVTGRTSCSSPPIQTLPREGNIRECFVPAHGHVLLAVDYRMLELCTFAQIALRAYGRSRMAELINAGEDLHIHTAAMILNIEKNLVTKEQRQKAKALNFGVPGGMGSNGLATYAREVYGVSLTEQEAAQWRDRLLDIYPELRQHLGERDDIDRLAQVLDQEDLPPGCRKPEIAAMILKRIAGGATETSQGRGFSDNELAWAWAQIRALVVGKDKGLREDATRRRGSRDLQRAIDPPRVAVTLTGRVRAGCSYCESRNTPFQGLAADGAKLALYALVRQGYRIVAFVHDEVLIEIPEQDDYRAVANAVCQIMETSMRMVCPDVAIGTERAVMRRWQKGATARYDEVGRLVAFGDTKSFDPLSTQAAHAPLIAGAALTSAAP